MTTLKEMLALVRSRLAGAGVEDPMAEARILVGGLLDLGRTDLITRGEDRVAPEDEVRIFHATDRRVAGEPPYRILGRRGFHGIELRLSRDTLEPRPDTEVLVDLVLDLVSERRNELLEILDLGTGTGAICLALLANLPLAQGTGTDLAQGALDTAKDNAALNGLSDRFGTTRSNWFEAVSGLYDVIVSNPPYIRSDIVPTLDREVREHDPLLALDGGTDGLDAYRVIARDAGRFLNPSGLVAVETGYDQKATVRAVFESAGFQEVAARADLAGHDRAQVFRAVC
ncbi:MAG: peptide chain release factor N(5)-glutamine methyltransferase [Rhizobium sp.]|nr:peptide chain release factor N(5)-glutamine methyltransferase [Rhizobium sp.]